MASKQPSQSNLANFNKFTMNYIGSREVGAIHMEIIQLLSKKINYAELTYEQAVRIIHKIDEKYDFNNESLIIIYAIYGFKDFAKHIVNGGNELIDALYTFKDCKVPAQYFLHEEEMKSLGMTGMEQAFLELMLAKLLEIQYTDEENAKAKANKKVWSYLVDELRNVYENPFEIELKINYWTTTLKQNIRFNPNRTYYKMIISILRAERIYDIFGGTLPPYGWSKDIQGFIKESLAGKAKVINKNTASKLRFLTSGDDSEIVKQAAINALHNYAMCNPTDIDRNLEESQDIELKHKIKNIANGRIQLAEMKKN